MSKFTIEETAKVKEYLECLRKFSPIKQDEPDEETLECMTQMVLNLIETFGQGDPIKAAKKHGQMLDWVRSAIKLSSSDKSDGMH